MNLFGKKKAAPPPNPADAIIKLRGTMETLTKREAYIQKKIELMVGEAKQKMARKDKNGALFALKKKKMYEAEITKIQGAMMNLESQAMSLEGSATNMEVFGAMRTGAKAMGAMRGAMCVRAFLWLVGLVLLVGVLVSCARTEGGDGRMHACMHTCVAVPTPPSTVLTD